MISDELKKYTESNRDAWNEVMPRHRRASAAKWDDFFARPGAVCFDDVELEPLRRVGVEGRAVAHLCCNNGVELLSLKNMGAGECVGFDICDEAVAEARERAARCRIDCRFVRSNVYEIDNSYSGRFDLVYVSAGCLGWMPDIGRFLAKAAALLRAGGRVFIREIHPVSEMLPFDDDDTSDVLRIAGPYFKKEPYVEKGGLDYVGRTEYEGDATQYWFVHTISDIMTGLIGNGLTIELFREYATDVSAGHARVEAANAGIPLSYILVAVRSHRGISPLVIA